MLKHKFWSAIVAAFACFVLHSLAFALPSGDSGYGTYVTYEHRNQIYERVGYLAPNITALNNPWVNCPPDFRQWLPWVAYGGAPGGYIWYGCANTPGELVGVATDTMRNLMLGDLEREPAYHDGNVALEFYLGGGALFGRAYQTAFPVEENLGVADEGDPATCQEPGTDGADTSESFGNPVHPGAGNKIQIESDYRCEGPTRLSFHRYYNSASRSIDAWGPNWSADYFQKVRVLPTAGAAVYVGRPSGRYYAFRYNGTGWSAVSTSVTEHLEDVLSDGARIGWIFRTRNDTAERYDATGRLLSITYRDGLTITLNYDAQGRLSFVEGPIGHRLSFQYNEQNRVVAMTNPAGASFTYEYDGSENLSLVTHPDTSTRKYHYEEASTAFANALTGITDENGARFATWSYLEADSTGRNPSRPISSAHAGEAERYSAQYNSTALFNWDSAAIIDPLGVTRTYTFGTFGGRRKTISIVGPPCPSCGPPSTSYDGNGYVISITDWNGNTTNYTRNDPAGRHELETSRIEAAGSNVQRTVTTEWHPTFRLPIRIAEPKRITALTYDEHGNLISLTIQPTNDANGAQVFSGPPNGPGRTWTWSHVYSTTVPGLIQQITADGPRTDVADVTVYRYYPADASCAPSAADGSVIGCRGQRSSITNAKGHVTQFGRYNAHGQPEQIVDPNGLPLTLSYDMRQRLTGLDVGEEVTSYEYFPTGLVKKVTRPDASALLFTYDDAHRLTQIADNAGNKIVYTLDAMGNRTQEQVYDPANALKRARSQIYSNLNRLIQEVSGANPASEITQFGYDNQGSLSALIDPLGQTTTGQYDALNRLVKVVYPAAAGTAPGGSSQYGYDELDQFAQFTDPRTLSSSYSQDGLGTVTQGTSPDTGLASSAADAAGNVVNSKDARGVSGNFAFDALNRIIQEVYASAQGATPAPVSIFYTYDQGANAKGRLTGLADATGTTSYTYDSHGRVTQDRRVISGVTYATAYGYDAAVGLRPSRIRAVARWLTPAMLRDGSLKSLLRLQAALRAPCSAP